MAAPPEGTRVDEAERQGWSEAWSTYANEHTWSVVDELQAVAQEVGRTPAQVALNWLLQQPAVTARIIGARTPGHLEDNLGAVGWALSSEHLRCLDEVSRLEEPYPYSFIRNQRGNR